MSETRPHPIEAIASALDAARDAVDRRSLLAAAAVASQIESVPIEAILDARQTTGGVVGLARDLAYYLAATSFDLSAYRIAIITSGGSSRLDFSRRGVGHAIERVVNRRDDDPVFDRRLEALDQILRRSAA